VDKVLEYYCCGSVLKKFVKIYRVIWGRPKTFKRKGGDGILIADFAVYPEA
jgi:hypothetical protein